MESKFNGEIKFIAQLKITSVSASKNLSESLFPTLFSSLVGLNFSFIIQKVIEWNIQHTQASKYFVHSNTIRIKFHLPVSKQISF